LTINRDIEIIELTKNNERITPMTAAQYIKIELCLDQRVDEEVRLSREWRALQAEREYNRRGIECYYPAYERLWKKVVARIMALEEVRGFGDDAELQRAIDQHWLEADHILREDREDAQISLMGEDYDHDEEVAG
jgi:hypothetical protein